MKEIDVQSLIIDSVKAHHGTGHKLSNRFLIGVSDLLIKQSHGPAALIEVKLQKIGSTTKPDFEFKLDVTIPQREFLQRYFDVGMWAGVFSFVERGGRGVRGLSMALFRLDAIKRLDYRVSVGMHHPLSPHPNREKDLAEYMMREIHHE